jgi:ubiquinone/menaquinone biosynthesis C-methylase UbiE
MAERITQLVDASDHDELVRRSFEQQTNLFEGKEAVFAQQPDQTLAWLQPMDPHMIVLDVACGAAHTAELAAPHVRQVVGIDLTATLLRLGGARLRDAGITNVLLQEGNATALPFVDDSFDLVACRSSLHHFPRPELALAEMARVCRPGGRVVVSDMVAPDASVREQFDELHRLIDPSHVRVLLEDEVSSLMSTAVGPITRHDPIVPVALAFEPTLTDAADRPAALAMVSNELTGGPVTGLEPVDEDGQLMVSYRGITIHATPQA